MKTNGNLPITLTEAQSQIKVFVVAFTADYSQSSSRPTPYIDIYRSRTSIMETPAEHLQKAAEEDKAFPV